MTEDVSNVTPENDSESVSLGDNYVRGNFVQITITLGLILGPVLLPFVLIFPDWFSSVPFLLEISIIVTILFITSSGITAYLREKKIEK